MLMSRLPKVQGGERCWVWCSDGGERDSVGCGSAEKRWDLDGEGDGGAEREAERGLLVGSS